MNLRTLLRHTLVYGSGTILARAVGFLLLPLYTHYLPPAEYGKLFTLDIMIMIVSVVVSGGLTGAVARFYYAYKTDEDRREVLSTAAISSLVFTIATTAILVPFARPIAAAFLSDPSRGLWIILALASYVLNINVELGLSFMRVEQKSALFTALNLGRLLVQVACNIYFIAVARLGVEGYLWSAIVSGVILEVIVAGWTWRRAGLRFSRAKLVELRRYALPLIPSTFGTLIQNYADKLFLRYWWGFSVVGVYSLGHKFGMLMSELVIQPFYRIWGVSRFDVYETNGAEAASRLSSRVFTYYVLALASAWVGMSALIAPVVRIMAPTAPDYWEAARYVPWIALGYGIRGLSYFYEGGAYVMKRPGIVAVSNVGAAALNATLNLALIPWLGAAGAAATTIFTFTAQAIYTGRRNQELLPFAHERGRLARIAAAAVACFVVSRWARAEGIWLEVAMAAAIVLLFPALLTALGFWSAEERDAARQALGRVVGRGSGATGGRAPARVAPEVERAAQTM